MLLPLTKDPALLQVSGSYFWPHQLNPARNLICTTHTTNPLRRPAHALRASFILHLNQYLLVSIPTLKPGMGLWHVLQNNSKQAWDIAVTFVQGIDPRRCSASGVLLFWSSHADNRNVVHPLIVRNFHLCLQNYLRKIVCTIKNAWNF